jgi:hypothetical protein
VKGLCAALRPYRGWCGAIETHSPMQNSLHLAQICCCACHDYNVNVAGERAYHKALKPEVVE